MKLFLTSLILPLQILSHDFPSIYGGSCAAFPNSKSLYYVGGITDKESQLINHSILKLDYTTLKLTADSTAPWKTVLKDTVGSAFGNLVATNDKLIYYGGRNVFINESMYNYNPVKNEVLLDRIGSEFPGTTLNFDSSLNSSSTDPVDHLSTFININTKADGDVRDKFLLFGGILSTQNLKKPHYGAGKISVYNSKLDGWNLHHLNSSQGLNVYDHAASFNIKDNKMYVLGGKLYNGAYLPLNLIFVYDSDKDSWDVKHTVGKEPSSRIGLTSLLINNQLVVTGGSDNDDLTNLSDGIFVLDLATFTWNQVHIDGFQKVGYRACAQLVGKDLEKEDGVLIYSFGLNDGFKPTTQLLDAKDLKLITEYHFENNRSSKSIWVTVIVPIILSLIVAIIGALLFRKYYLKRKLNKNRNGNGIDGDDLVESDHVKLNQLDRITYRLNDNNDDNLQFLEGETVVENRKQDFIK